MRPRRASAFGFRKKVAYLLEPGYLGIDCGDQIGIVDRHRSTLPSFIWLNVILLLSVFTQLPKTPRCDYFGCGHRQEARSFKTRPILVCRRGIVILDTIAVSNCHYEDQEAGIIVSSLSVH